MAERQAALRAKQSPFGSLREVPKTPSAPPEPPHAPPQPILVDNTNVLRAVEELTLKVDRLLSTNHVEIEQIHVEIADIAGRIKATKAEMAQIRHPLSDDDKFKSASHELGEVVKSTETATNRIMNQAEHIEELINEVRALVGDGYASAKLNEVHDALVHIYEACNFQDLTGQRITKVVTTLTFIEQRIEAMMGVWNRREFEAMPLPAPLTKMDGDLQLRGPAAELGETISQDDIDKLFG